MTTSNSKLKTNFLMWARSYNPSHLLHWAVNTTLTDIHLQQNDNFVTLLRQNPKLIVRRLVSTVILSAYFAARSFAATCIGSIPMGILMNVHHIRSPVTWMRAGLHSSVMWGAVSACYVAGETVSCLVRQEDDRYINPSVPYICDCT